MSITTIAQRYARALADVVIERGETNEVVKELHDFAEMIRQHEQLRDVFASPVLPLERKSAVLNQLLARLKLRPTSSNVLHLLLRNARLHELDQIMRALANELDARNNIISAEVTTARELGEQEKVLLRDRLKGATGKDVRLRFRTDPDIIGGVVTRIDSLIYDGSIKNQLAQMKRTLMNANLA